MNRPPHDVPCNRSIGVLAPKFRAAVEAILAEMGDAKLAETLRTAERQAFLYGFGRTYDDGRGLVTNASSHLLSWHGFGLAADIIHATQEWDAGDAWFAKLGACAKRHGCDWGGDWRHADLPHVQFGTLRDSPSDTARELLRDGGLEAVWRAVSAA